MCMSNVLDVLQILCLQFAPKPTQTTKHSKSKSNQKHNACKTLKHASQNHSTLSIKTEHIVLLKYRSYNDQTTENVMHLIIKVYIQKSIWSLLKSQHSIKYSTPFEQLKNAQFEPTYSMCGLDSQQCLKALLYTENPNNYKTKHNVSRCPVLSN